MAKSAHVITVGLNSFLNTSIRAWFDQFNFMPPIPLTAARIDTIGAGQASLTHLLSVMAASPHKAFILIIHGHSDGSGLYLRLTPEQAKPHTSYFDLQRLMDIEGSGRELDRTDQGKMGVDRRGSHQILDLMHKVQAKQIECIEFRACNLGRNASSLERFRRFFGGKLAGAPDLHSFFGSGPVSTDPRQLLTHTRSHNGNWETYNFPSAYKDPKLVCCFSLDGDSKPTGGHIVADSTNTLSAWIKQFVMPTGSHGSGNMALHGLWVADIKIAPKKPGEKARSVPAAVVLEREQVESPLGGWGGPSVQRFIPPLSENYAKHIIYAK